MKAKVLESIRQNERALPLYLSALQNLVDSGIFNFVRLLGVVNSTPKATAEEMALEGARSYGFNQCLDVLFNFKEWFLDANPDVERPEATYGSLELAVESGYLTKEEADAIRTGSTDEYFNKLSAQARAARNANPLNKPSSG